MTSEEERVEVAESIRYYAKESDESAYEFIRGYWPNDLADIIDQTCDIDALDTGERADYECSEHIMHCSACNAEFGYVLYSEDRGVSMDDKPRFCPNCGARCVDE